MANRKSFTAECPLPINTFSQTHDREIICSTTVAYEKWDGVNRANRG
jgi:hypothetical protein